MSDADHRKRGLVAEAALRSDRAAPHRGEPAIDRIVCQSARTWDPRIRVKKEPPLEFFLSEEICARNKK
jgi:hypothetical protein